VQPKLAFSVGAIIDQTGKEQLTEGGTGKFVTQGAGDMVQSALFRTGVTVLNRRDPRVLETEVKWGVRDSKGIVPSNYFITGSINSLDFIPGGGFDIQVAGVGPQYRQSRILVGLDLSLTDTRTGRVVANVPLQKQIYSSEFNFGIGRFMGDDLVLLDIGGREREALHFALRQMLNLGTFELLTQVMPAKQYAECREFIDRMHGFVDQTSTAERAAAYLSKARDVEVTPVLIDTEGNDGEESGTGNDEPTAESKQPQGATPAAESGAAQNGNGNGNGQHDAAPMSDEVKRIILTN
jgi:curli biogenesis system outer membrane secretion channel CsgG